MLIFSLLQIYSSNNIHINVPGHLSGHLSGVWVSFYIQQMIAYTRQKQPLRDGM